MHPGTKKPNTLPFHEHSVLSEKFFGAARQVISEKR
jgi:hypothetical protein